MVEDYQIFWAAKFLVERWGDHASAYAGCKANELFARGNAEGCAIWRRVRIAVEELQGAPVEEIAIH
jgi:hypothetical protein